MWNKYVTSYDGTEIRWTKWHVIAKTWSSADVKYAGVLPSPVAHSKSSSSVISSLSSDQYEKLIYPLNNTPTGNQVCTGGQGGGSGVTMQPLINQATLTYPTAPKTATVAF
ncbi:hypothetical protein M9H77_02578 [Catharanthus roseus]|uniref:Uncharacterized protein n=1 Tax=Catharanthus roseus TaxID=4058 RepID=A0ACC0C8V2_CATRO|nr:hypothetical protein M9H77_02578 [Catharanthus roseus]